MRYVIWCDACGQREVPHTGDLCGRCQAPDDAAALTPARPTTADAAPAAAVPALARRPSMSTKGWTSQRTPNAHTALDEFHRNIQAKLPTARSWRPQDGRFISGGYRMNARWWRAWRRRLDRLDRSTR